MSALRIGDAERDAAAADLGEHYALGRLRPDEHAERLDALWSARTAADVEALLADLPSLHPDPRAAPPRRRHRWNAVPFLPILAVLVLLTVWTHRPFFLLGLAIGALLFLRRARSWRVPEGGTPARYRRVC